MKAAPDPWLKTAETQLLLGGRTVTITHPSNSDDLITEADYVMDERLPYWADIWPASRVLADVIAAQKCEPGETLIELGCGLGVVSLAAAMAGYNVTATDYYTDALSFARHNVKANSGVEINTLHLDWRHLPAEMPRFNVVLASDVLYELEYAALLPGIMLGLLAPGGRVIVADPGRIGVVAFFEKCAEMGLKLRSQSHHHIHDTGRELEVEVYTLVG